MTKSSLRKPPAPLLPLGCILASATASWIATSELPAQALPLDSGLISFDIGCNCSNTGYQGTVGWTFTVNTPKIIGFLGVYDQAGDGLSAATDVGLWDTNTQTLLASVTVPSGTAGILSGQFRYAGISSVTLMPGTTYTIGAQYKQPYQSDWYQLLTINNVFAPWITYQTPAERFGSSLAIPFNVGQSPYGIYGPNLAEVPAPLPIFGAGAAFSWSRRLRRRVASASRPKA